MTRFTRDEVEVALTEEVCVSSGLILTSCAIWGISPKKACWVELGHGRYAAEELGSGNLCDREQKKVEFTEAARDKCVVKSIHHRLTSSSSVVEDTQTPRSVIIHMLIQDDS